MVRASMLRPRPEPWSSFSTNIDFSHCFRGVSKCTYVSNYVHLYFPTHMHLCSYIHMHLFAHPYASILSWSNTPISLLKCIRISKINCIGLIWTYSCIFIRKYLPFHVHPYFFIIWIYISIFTPSINHHGCFCYYKQ